MNVLVTGGAGFIGSHLVDALIKRGYAVRVLDNFSTGKRQNLHPQAELFEADIRNPVAIGPAFRGVEGVFHAAALPNVQLSVDNPVETNAINVTGTLNVLLAARQAGVKRIVFSASSAAYGDPVSLPLKEDMQPRPKSPYALQKLVGEEYVRLANMLWNLETVSLRYFNVYGPRMTSEGAYVTVIAVFNLARLANQPLTITGDGTQTRDFVYVDDVVHANLLAMGSPRVGHGEIINIGSGSSRSVNLVAEKIGGPTKYLPPRIEPHDTMADVSQAKVLLGWQPTVAFDDGLARTVTWYQQARQAS